MLLVCNWSIAFVSLQPYENKKYEARFSETKNKNRKEIYRKDGNVHYKRDLHKKNISKRSF